MIVVAGEALIDLIEEDGVLRPHLGGGPFNTAVALGRLGVPVSFLGRLSTDRFGRQLHAFLAESGVDLRYALTSAAPTPLAMVHGTGDGGHTFSFYLASTAYADLAVADLPELGPEVVAVCAGTLGLATDPPRGAIEALLERESERRTIVIDPNVRPDVVGDHAAYLARFEHWARFAHVVKLSDADAEWLYPGEGPDSVAAALLDRGVRLVAVTLGAEGALAVTASGSARVASPPVEVVDTVGAGDAFGAAFLHWLWTHDRLDSRAVGGLDDGALGDALRFAAAVGALQCARAGAVPPSLAEVEAFVGAAA